jgi:hypothetical protein
MDTPYLVRRIPQDVDPLNISDLFAVELERKEGHW